jgi:hypothetical protein
MSNARPAAGTWSAVSPARLQLAQLMRMINFGRIEGLVVRGGEPVMYPKPKVVLEVKFGCEDRTRPESSRADAECKAQLLELFARLDDYTDVRIQVLTIKHGLPFHMQIEAPI